MACVGRSRGLRRFEEADYLSFAGERKEVGHVIGPAPGFVQTDGGDQAVVRAPFYLRPVEQAPNLGRRTGPA